jgi:hypothetical protein
MATSRDHNSGSARVNADLAVDDLALPEAVAEEVAGGDGAPTPVYHQLVPGNSGWTPVTLKRGMTSE